MNRIRSYQHFLKQLLAHLVLVLTPFFVSGAEENNNSLFFSEVDQTTGKVIDKVNTWVDSVVVMLPNFFLAILVLLLFFLLAKLVRGTIVKILRRLVKRPSVNQLIGTIFYITIIIVGIFVALGVMNLDKTVTSLLAGAGIIGLGLSFAFQQPVMNFISGVILAMQTPFKEGDVIQTNDHFGIVEEIHIRTTILRTFQGQRIIIPNRDVNEKSIENFTWTGERRIDLEGRVSYADDLDHVERIGLNAIKQLNYLKEDSESVFIFTEFDDFSIKFEARFWIPYNNQEKPYFEAISEAIKALHKAFAQHNITIPYPIRTLDFNIRGGKDLKQMLGDGKKDPYDHQI